VRTDGQHGVNGGADATTHQEARVEALAPGALDGVVRGTALGRGALLVAAAGSLLLARHVKRLRGSGLHALALDGWQRREDAPRPGE
jgi:hypothetical protein